ncbi:uncharacterized protein LOC132044855 [Lycium ferocissimum]|uniref:uncharacterized protein LOC132044855 n=1 Tax=Lycium ferocissimum TaxID=112874 RepID=UPI0028168279|nr:uncharacterized protein LOC132044855 [Lycium ferocissimum]
MSRKKATATQKGKRATGAATSRTRQATRARDEIQSEGPSETSHTPPLAPALAPQLEAPGQDVRDAIQLLTRLVAAQVQWGDNAPPAVWREFSDAFILHYLLLRYAPAMVAEMEDSVHRFVAGLGPHLIDACTIGRITHRMDISGIQAYAQNLEDRKRQRRTDRDRDRGHGKRARTLEIGGESRGGQRPQYSRYPFHSAGSAPPRFSGPGFDQSSYSGAGQSSRASGSQYRPESGQMRPLLPRCAQCGKLHAGQCRLGLDVCYACGQPGHKVRQCLMRESGGMVQPTGFVASSSSMVRPSGQVSQTPAE